MSTVNCPLEACKFYSHSLNGICTKGEINLEMKIVWMGGEMEVLICKDFEWPESTINLNQKGE